MLSASLPVVLKCSRARRKACDPYLKTWSSKSTNSVKRSRRYLLHQYTSRLMSSVPPLQIPRRKSTISSIHMLIFTNGNGHCARNFHFHHAVDRPLSSVAPPALRCLDQTGHHLAHAGDADRSYQKQVRTCRRKCAFTTATDHPAAT